MPLPSVCGKIRRKMTPFSVKLHVITQKNSLQQKRFFEGVRCFDKLFLKARLYECLHSFYEKKCLPGALTLASLDSNFKSPFGLETSTIHWYFPGSWLGSNFSIIKSPLVVLFSLVLVLNSISFLSFFHMNFGGGSPDARQLNVNRSSSIPYTSCGSRVNLGGV